MRLTTLLLILLVMVVAHEAMAWEVDFSRRNRRQPASSEETSANKSDEVRDTQSNYSGNTQTVRVVKDTPVQPAGTEIVPAEMPKAKKKLPSRLDSFVTKATTNVNYDRQHFVILNTAKGFIPSSVRIHKGLHYVVHVVNINDDKKNVSFMLDGFNQHHATYFGNIKSFNIDPEKEGVYAYQCPETSSEGRMIVIGNTASPVPRAVSSEEQ